MRLGSIPTSAMILAAGRGSRLAAITATTPKPLIKVGGYALIDLALEQLQAVSVPRVVVNTHHLAERVEDHVRRWQLPQLRISREEELLDTGGGVRRALPWLGLGPFYVVNSDLVWLDPPGRAMRRLADAWDDSRMDVLLLLAPAVNVEGYSGPGDFAMLSDGKLVRRAPSTMTPFVFTGAQILAPRAFIGSPQDAFSLNRIYDAAALRGRLYGLRHEGDWIDAGTPERLHLASEAMIHLRQGRLL
jgi:MurNAc alpha-1-phosphate uridylyltransferase